MITNSLQQGLILHYTGENAKDKTPYQNNGTIVGTSLTTDRLGQANKALAFDGDDSIDTGMGIGLSAGDFSCSQWIKWTSGTYSIAQRRVVSPIASDWFFCHTDSLFWFRGVVLGASEKTQILNDGKWHHLVMTWDVSEAKYKGYLDGVYIGQSTTVTNYGGVDTIKIGQRADLTGVGFAGSIGETRLYNRILTDAEVTQLYKQGVANYKLASLSQGLVGHWDMNGNAKDKTPYQNDGTVTGATLTTNKLGQTDRAYLFDGTNDYIALPTLTSNPNFSISGWVKVDGGSLSGATGYANIIGRTNTNRLLISSNNTPGSSLVFLAQLGSGNHFSTALVKQGEWAHFAYVYNNSTTTGQWFVNGVPDSILVASATFSGAQRLGNQGIDGYWLNGKLSDIRRYNRALSASEVLNLYKTY